VLASLGGNALFVERWVEPESARVAQSRDSPRRDGLRSPRSPLGAGTPVLPLGSVVAGIGSGVSGPDVRADGYRIPLPVLDLFATARGLNLLGAPYGPGQHMRAGGCAGRSAPRDRGHTERPRPFGFRNGLLVAYALATNEAPEHIFQAPQHHPAQVHPGRCDHAAWLALGAIPGPVRATALAGVLLRRVADPDPARCR
jgi:hypothetical protein